ncbi:hypothetical protein HN011_000479 [Eciton burchellii]|nr:hypothetical protein HN011_000479 [Eciton burchellii]
MHFRRVRRQHLQAIIEGQQGQQSLIEELARSEPDRFTFYLALAGDVKKVTRRCSYLDRYRRLHFSGVFLDGHKKYTHTPTRQPEDTRR